MTLTAGTRLGPYQVVGPLGAGGMGEVYRARDTRLERDVAIKVLPSHLFESPESRKRFDREAKTISRLSHPHICALYDVGQESGVDYLVMECLEGETLAARLASGPLSADQVCRFGAEIGEALGTAHASGVVHRDLKPGNVMLTKTGSKLLDFGLAKQALGLSSGEVSGMATATGPLTEEGAVLGTVQYMAPEQVEGKEADTRTDVFALGAVLYEMATGRRAFPGKTAASVASAILRDEPPPIAELSPVSPPALDRLVRRCLAKDPEERWQSARDVAAELRFLRNEISGSGRAPAAARAPRISLTRALPWAIAALAVAAAVPAWLALRRSAPERRRVERLSFPTPPLALGIHPVAPAAVLSPDGRRVAFVAAPGEKRLLYVRELDAPEARQLPGTEGAEGPFFSPDGLSVGYSTEEPALKRISISGGAPETICRAGTRIHGGSWCSDGTIVFSTQRKIWRVSASGGEPKALTTPEGETRHYFPEFLPGCRAILYSMTDGGTTPLAVVAQSLGAGPPVTLVPVGSSAHFALPGHLLYAVNGTIVAVPFDPEHLVVTGAPVHLVDGVAHGAPQERALGQFSVSAEGTLAFVPGPSFSGGSGELVWVERDGSVSLIKQVGMIAGARLSPDGRRIAYMEVSTQDPQKLTRHIWVYDIERGTTSRVSFEGDNWWPAWMPDGRRLVFVHSVDQKNYVLALQNADGTGSLETFAAASGRARQPESWTPDGRALLADDIAYPNPGTDFNVDIVAIGRDGDRQTKRLLATPFSESLPFVSPDGRWLAYVSDESGRREVYMRPYPALDAKFQISPNGGDEPAWAPSGRELFYRDGAKMMSVEVPPGESLRPGKPRLLFQVETVRGTRMVRDYDVSPDGRRFLMIRLPYAVTAERVNLVLGWPALLKRR